MSALVDARTAHQLLPRAQHHRTTFTSFPCSVAEAIAESGEIRVRNPESDDREPPKTFTFDHVFGPT